MYEFQVILIYPEYARETRVTEDSAAAALTFVLRNLDDPGYLANPRQAVVMTLGPAAGDHFIAPLLYILTPPVSPSWQFALA